MRKYFLYLLILICLLSPDLLVGRTNAEDSNVNATVDNPITSTSPTPTVSITPTPSKVLSPSPTPTPTPVSGLSPSPTPVLVPGQIYLDISGFVSPFASIVMTTNSVFLRSTVADKDGNFYISQIQVSKGFSNFCLQAIDFKRVGESLTCFKIPPITSSTAKRNIFLPPTLALSARKTNPKSTVIGFGYGMPGSSITLHVSADILLSATADKTGLYRTDIKNLAVGSYSLFATAKYQNKNSEKPSKALELQSLSAGAGFGQNAQSMLQKSLSWFGRFFGSYGWVVIPIFILIIILLSRRIKDRIEWLIEEEEYAVWKKKKTPVHGGHHAWFLAV